jgi:hypothetical protein
LNTAAEKFLNSRDALFVPDFHDMLGLTEKVNQEAGLVLSSEEVRQTAQELFVVVVKMLKKRRQKDFKIAIKLEEEELQDPADNDPELEKKLQANKAKQKSEDEILGEFTHEQEELNIQAEEVVDENADDSAKESDEEEEDSENDKAEGLVDDEDENEEGEGEKPSSSSGTNGVMVKPADTIDLADTSEESQSEEEAEDSSTDLSDSNDSGSTKAKKPRLEKVK